MADPLLLSIGFVGKKLAMIQIFLQTPLDYRESSYSHSSLFLLLLDLLVNDRNSFIAGNEKIPGVEVLLVGEVFVGDD